MSEIDAYSARKHAENVAHVYRTTGWESVNLCHSTTPDALEFYQLVCDFTSQILGKNVTYSLSEDPTYSYHDCYIIHT